MGAPSFVVYLRRREVPVSEELFDFGDIDARVEEEGSGGGSEGVRAIQALLARGSIGTLDRMHLHRVSV